MDYPTLHHWKITLRRNKPCVTGRIYEGEEEIAKHVYISWYGVRTNIVVCAETGRIYRLARSEHLETECCHGESEKSLG